MSREMFSEMLFLTNVKRNSRLFSVMFLTNVKSKPQLLSEILFVTNVKRNSLLSSEMSRETHESIMLFLAKAGLHNY